MSHTVIQPRRELLEISNTRRSLEVKKSGQTISEVAVRGVRGPRGDRGDSGREGESGDYFGVGKFSFVIGKDSNEIVTTLTYSNGTVLTLSRNPDGSVSSITSNAGKTKSFLRNSDGSVSSVVLS